MAMQIRPQILDATSPHWLLAMTTTSQVNYGDDDVTLAEVVGWFDRQV
jgi:hypothetical protein